MHRDAGVATLAVGTVDVLAAAPEAVINKLAYEQWLANEAKKRAMGWIVLLAMAEAEKP
ncbi:MAG: hypothetical protein M3A44_11075 [Gammaproteobacteria bacterium]